MAKTSKAEPLTYLAFATLLAAIPLVLGGPYELQIIVMILTAGIGAMAVRLIISTGQWSFGQSAFMAVGAYLSALLVMRLGFPFWLAMASSGVISAIFGAAIGYPALRLKGAYFAILTLVLVQLVGQLIVLLPQITGGRPGLRDIPPVSLFGVDFVDRLPNYYVAVVLFLAMLATTYAIETSRMGHVFRAIRQNETLAQSVGINVVRYRVFAFTIACFFSGLLGSFSAHYYGIAHVDFYGMWQSVYMVAYAILGGVGAVYGPVIGAIVLTLLIEGLRGFQQYQAVAYAVVLIAVMRFLPGGLVSLAPIAHEIAVGLIKRSGRKSVSLSPTTTEIPEG